MVQGTHTHPAVSCDKHCWKKSSKWLNQKIVSQAKSNSSKWEEQRETKEQGHLVLSYGCRGRAAGGQPGSASLRGRRQVAAPSPQPP